MPRVLRFCYYIGENKIDVLASSLTRDQIKDHIKFDRGYKYSVLVHRPLRPRTRRENVPVPPVLPQPPHQSPPPHQSQPQSQPQFKYQPQPRPVLEPEPIFKCFCCGNRMYRLYGEDPSIICTECWLK